MDRFTLQNISLRQLLLSFIFFFISNSSFAYTQHNLVSDGAIPADHIDANLINPWGLAFGVTSPVWISNAETGKSTIYDGLGNALPLVVTIPPAAGGTTGSPTGIVFNNTPNWMVSSMGKSAAAVFIFATEDGTIAAWSPTVNPTQAITVVDNSKKGASYKGLTKGANGSKAYLYATNFHNDTIDVFDGDFMPVVVPGGFKDPNLPAGFAPFGIQNINGDIYVTYGKQDAMKHDAINGPGLGVVNVFDTEGHLIKRVATFDTLNAPWGIALAPAKFGHFSNTLLIGNFGNGRIHAYDYTTYEPLGKLRDMNKAPIEIDGLWGISFGNGFNNQPTDTLFFTAGPFDESHGLYGKLTA